LSCEVIAPIVSWNSPAGGIVSPPPAPPSPPLVSPPPAPPSLVDDAGGSVSPPPELLCAGAEGTIVGAAVVLIAGRSVADIVGVGIVVADIVGVGIVVGGVVVAVIVIVGMVVVAVIVVVGIEVVAVMLPVVEFVGSVVTAPPVPSVSSFLSPHAVNARAQRPSAPKRNCVREIGARRARDDPE
jgi:hypothetical protein